MNLAAIRQSHRDMRDATVLRLKLEGMSNIKIAAEVGIDKNTVRKIIKAHAPAEEVEIPAWVLPHHVETYRSIATEAGEEAAASWARNSKKAERMLLPNEMGA